MSGSSINNGTKLCICRQCKSPDDITCVPDENAQDINEYMPRYLSSAFQYERKFVGDYYGKPYLSEWYRHSGRASHFKHYMGLIVYEINTKGVIKRLPNKLDGRMWGKLSVINFLTHKEIELKLSSNFTSIENSSNENTIDRETFCQLWPDHFFLINQNWALLVTSKILSNYENTWYAAFIIQTDYKSGTFEPKDLLMIWDDPTRRVILNAKKNTVTINFDDKENVMETPMFSFIVSNSYRSQQEPVLRFDSVSTLFASVNFEKEKFHVLASFGHQINWRHLNFISLVGQEMRQFVMQSIRDGRGQAILPITYEVSFRQLITGSLNDLKNERGIRAEQLQLPTGFEGEFVSRNFLRDNFGYSNVTWSSTNVTLCLPAILPSANASNIFLLDYLTLKWSRIEWPGLETAIRPNLRVYTDALARNRFYESNSDDGVLIVCGFYHLMFEGEEKKRMDVTRWYRVHVRRPASLFELTWRQAYPVLLNKSQNVDDMNLICDQLENIAFEM